MDLEGSWIKSEDYSNYFYKIFKVNSTYYKVGVTKELYSNSVRFWIELTSSRKKKLLNINKRLGNSDYESNKDSDGGIRALVKALEIIEDISNSKLLLRSTYGFKRYITIGWYDSKRKRVYSRLLNKGYKLTNTKYGFVFEKLIN
jgi:hypothetical protein